MDLDQLLAAPPLLHDDGRALWGIAPAVLRFLDGAIRPGANTLETGAGLSTLVFAINGAHHTCVVPAPSEIERIRAWCEASGVSTDHLTFHAERSEAVLPRLAEDPLDLVLIDGGHGFPAPFIDWFYAGRRLQPGGLLVVDDTQIWTGRVLRDFLEAEPGWELVEEIALRASMFRRTDAEGGPEWTDQPYVAARSHSDGARYTAARMLRAVRRRDVATLRRAARRLRRG